MGNHITFGENSLKISNGLTSVFIDVLTLAGSRLAQSDDEKRLIVWLAEKDQSVVGIGTVSFDISEIPWNSDNFAQNKSFILEVIKAAENRLGWDYLAYQPNEELLFPVLKQFTEMISNMTAENIDVKSAEEWLDAADKDDPVLCGFPKCEKHGTLLTCFGCHICNN